MMPGIQNRDPSSPIRYRWVVLVSLVTTGVAISLGLLGWVIQSGGLAALYALAAALVSQGTRREALARVGVVVAPFMLLVTTVMVGYELVHVYPFGLAVPLGAIAGSAIARIADETRWKRGAALVVFSAVSIGAGLQFMPDWITWAFSLDRPAIAEPSLSSISFQYPDGPIVDASEWRGKTIVLDLWTTTCGVCYASFPEVADFRSTFTEADSVEVFAVHLATGPDDRQEGIRRYEAGGYTLPLLLANVSFEQAREQLGIRGVPNAVVLNPDGFVHYVGHPQYRRGALVQNAWDIVREARDAVD